MFVKNLLKVKLQLVEFYKAPNQFTYYFLPCSDNLYRMFSAHFCIFPSPLAYVFIIAQIQISVSPFFFPFSIL